jgi:glycosyltransferase involved in cell wall biosynthesis
VKISALFSHDQTVAMAHGYWFPVDDVGRASELSIRERLRMLLHEVPPTLDYREALVVRGDTIQALATYRHRILRELGGFRETDGAECDHIMALRLLDLGEIRLVPQFVCARPAKSQRNSFFTDWRQFVRLLLVARRLKLSGRARFLQQPRYRLGRMILAAFAYYLGRRRLIGWRVRHSQSVARTFHSLARRLLYAVGMFYATTIDLLGWWPIAWTGDYGVAKSQNHRQVAYVFGEYPILSETFIRREMDALEKIGIAYRIVAETAGDSIFVVPTGAPVTYLERIDLGERKRLARRFLRRRPFVSLNLCLYVTFHRYQLNKSPYADADLIRRAACLAHVLEEIGITHIHCPWADTQAFVAKIAARLLRIPYSVHVRAHELYSRTFNCSLKDRLEGAEFVVTNSIYNESHLRQLLGPQANGRLHVIYNGLDLDSFQPPARQTLPGARLRILSVGRLVEQKGFHILLKACRKLKERGILFSCELIGGPQEELDANTYVLLKKLHRRLELEDAVRFAGAQAFSQVMDAYLRTDIFVLPCIIAADGSRDVTPNALLEAMAMELPVVSTPIGAIPEIVDDGINGWLIPPNDENALADAIEVLARDPDLRRRIGKAARTKIENRFDIRRNMARYAALYATI